VTTETQTHDWRKLHALGLPAGSVRALLALGVVGTVCGLIVRAPGEPLPDHLENLLFVVIGHYFAARGQVVLDPANGPPPLFLPRGSVRLLLVAALVAVGALSFRQEGLQALRGLFTLILVFAFLLGLLLARVTRWIARRRTRPSRWFADLQAIVGLLAVAAFALQLFVGVFPGPESLGVGRLGVEQGLAGLIGFYFGARS
jgi:hypothetical protein